MLEDIFIHPDYDNSGINVSFTTPEKCTKIDYEVIDGDIVVASGTVEAGSRDRLVSFRVEMSNFKPWSAESPFLYLLKLTVNSNGEALERRQSFGMTKIHVQDHRVHFNNTPFYFRGHIRGREAHDHPNLLGCSMKEYHEKNIRMTKAYGFNFIRFHSTIPDEEFLDAADRLGILLQVEIRKYFGKYQKQRAASGFDGDQTLVDEADWETMILKLRNHPCVMVYCMGNEIDQPGNNQRVKAIRKLTGKLDPTRLFLDTCSRGEYDRDTVDIDVQHMSYFAPFGKHYHMFDDSIHLSIYGSVTGKEMLAQDDEENPAFVMRREVPLRLPLIAHEVCHYNILRDPYKLDEKFRQYDVEKPWWIDELIKMIEAKGHKDQFQTMMRASTRFQYIWIKQCLESVRKSPILQGFHFLQLSDTDIYENANGLLDCFDDSKDIPPEKVLPFNSPTVIVADLPTRNFMGNSKISIPIYVSHFTNGRFESGSLHWSLTDKDSDKISISGSMDQFDLSQRGNRKLCRLELNLPDVSKPKQLVLSCRLVSDDGKFETANQWDIWLFPNNANRILPVGATVELKDLRLNKRYPQIICNSNTGQTDLLITDGFNKKVLRHLEQGKDALVLYSIEENRNRHQNREEYYLPSTWDRFKGIIWDRGHNCGGFLREHPIVKDFPHDGLIDWQFYSLIEDCDKIDLDDFPVPVVPIIEGVDKAVRDRFDVGRFDLSEFQYAYTMRKFAYLFELKVGDGRLLITGLNFKAVEQDEPATCWLFENMMNYMLSDKFNPQSVISIEELRDYLIKKGKSRRIKERMMTQYWQLDDAPLESKKYWKESEEWLRQED